MKFTEALDRKAEDIQRPPNLPIGHYTFQVKQVPDIEEFTSRAGDEFERVTFILVAVAPQDDVDPDELDEFGNVEGQMLRKTFMFNGNPDKKADFERSMFNIKRFLTDHLGVDESLEIGEALSASVGAQCIAEVKHRPDPDDAEVVYSEIGKTAAL